jgi:hypothetical protein
MLQAAVASGRTRPPCRLLQAASRLHRPGRCGSRCSAALVPVETLFSLASVAVMPVYGLMLCAPRSRLVRVWSIAECRIG